MITIEPNTLYVDDREPKTIFTALDRKKVVYIKQRLEVGDFIYNDWIFERKEIMDFWGSVKDGRIFEQVLRMKETSDNCIVIVSGSFIKGYQSKYYFNEQILTGAMASLIAKYKINVTRVEGDQQLIDLIAKICSKSLEPMTINFKPKIKPNKADIKTSMLCCLPNIGYKKAKLISANFSLYELFSIRKEDLLAIKGIGNSISDEIISFFDKK